MGESWKSFWMGAIAAIVIGVVAGAILNGSAITSSAQFSTSSTRL